MLFAPALAILPQLTDRAHAKTFLPLCQIILFPPHFTKTGTSLPSGF